jgi:hypothetical protein
VALSNLLLVHAGLADAQVPVEEDDQDVISLNKIFPAGDFSTFFYGRFGMVSRSHTLRLSIATVTTAPANALSFMLICLPGGRPMSFR